MARAKRRGTKVKLMSGMYIAASMSSEVRSLYARHAAMSARTFFNQIIKQRETNRQGYFFERRGNRYFTEFTSASVLHRSLIRIAKEAARLITN